jgi:hypothetical protein
MVLPKLPDVVPQFSLTLLIVPSVSVTSAETVTASDDVIFVDGVCVIFVMEGGILPLPPDGATPKPVRMLGSDSTSSNLVLGSVKPVVVPELIELKRPILLSSVETPPPLQLEPGSLPIDHLR